MELNDKSLSNTCNSIHSSYNSIEIQENDMEFENSYNNTGEEQTISEQSPSICFKN